jgi:hypothetical protein
MSLFAMYVVLCIQTMSVEFFNWKNLVPVTCCCVGRVFCLRRTCHLASFCHAQRKLGKHCCIVTRLQVGSFPSRGKRYLSTKTSRLTLGCTQLPFQWVLEALSQGVKRPGREDDHSPTSSAKVKNGWSYTSMPINAFMM